MWRRSWKTPGIGWTLLLNLLCEPAAVDVSVIAVAMKSTRKIVAMWMHPLSFEEHGIRVVNGPASPSFPK